MTCPSSSTRQDSSQPGTSVSPAGRAATASSQPAVLSWSVSATTSRPAARAALISWAGVNVPSEAVEWVCRSMRTGGDRSAAGLQGTEPGSGRASALLLLLERLQGGAAPPRGENPQAAGHDRDLARQRGQLLAVGVDLEAPVRVNADLAGPESS